jgi:hypothetical protein
MSNGIKHVSSDLQLAPGAQAVDFDDFDPELLYPGIEEEEEEEEDDPDEEPDEGEEGEEGGEDRGDDVDPSLAEEDEQDVAKDDEPAEEDDLDLEALAELAGDGGKAKMVPHARFNEVNETLKQERAARLQLEEELARARGQQPAPAAEKPDDKAKAYDFDAAEDRFMDALLDGDKEAAAKIRAEIRAEERKEFAQQSAQSAQQAADAELKRRDAESEQLAAQKVLTASIAKYPFLNHEGEDADADAIEDVIARRDLYLKQGMPFAKALATAVEKVAPRYARQEEQPKPSKQAATTAQINRNLDREKRIPAAMPGVGERGKDIDYAKLSEDEFDALPEQEKRKARGDFVKEDA